MSIEAPFSRFVQPSIVIDCMLVQDVSNGFSISDVVPMASMTRKHICTRFLCVPLSIRASVQINSQMNAGRLCFLTVRRL